MHNGTLRVGLIGLGNIARDRHLPAWNHVPFAQVVALADISPDALAKAGALRPDARRFTDWRELMAMSDLDAVDICTPTTLHTPMALEALSRGLHVICEKPLAATSAEVDQLREAADAAGTLLMTAQVFRFLPVSLQLKALIQEGRFGELYYTRAQWLRRRRLPPNVTFTRRELSGGGPLLDIGIHVLDLACWFLDFPEPITASAVTATKLAHRPDLGSEWGEWHREQFDVEDFAAGVVRFADGRTLMLETSWLAFQSEEELMRVQCYGTSAGLSWPDGVVVGETDRVPWTMRLEKSDDRRGFDDQILKFATAIRDNLSSPVPADQTRKVIRIIEGLYLAAAAHREVSL
jgi:predicted dehydrogenase